MTNRNIAHFVVKSLDLSWWLASLILIQFKLKLIEMKFARNSIKAQRLCHINFVMRPTSYTVLMQWPARHAYLTHWWVVTMNSIILFSYMIKWITSAVHKTQQETPHDETPDEGCPGVLPLTEQLPIYLVLTTRSRKLWCDILKYKCENTVYFINGRAFLGLIEIGCGIVSGEYQTYTHSLTHRHTHAYN